MLNTKIRCQNLIFGWEKIMQAWKELLKFIVYRLFVDSLELNEFLRDKVNIIKCIIDYYAYLIFRWYFPVSGFNVSVNGNRLETTTIGEVDRIGIVIIFCVLKLYWKYL